jgi:hypothetical protein
MMRLPLSALVIAGLDPAIHLFRSLMDARVKPGHDDLRATQPLSEFR